MEDDIFFSSQESDPADELPDLEDFPDDSGIEESILSEEDLGSNENLNISGSQPDPEEAGVARTRAIEPAYAVHNKIRFASMKAMIAEEENKFLKQLLEFKKYRAMRAPRRLNISDDQKYVMMSDTLRPLLGDNVLLVSGQNSAYESKRDFYDGLVEASQVLDKDLNQIFIVEKTSDVVANNLNTLLRRSLPPAEPMRIAKILETLAFASTKVPKRKLYETNIAIIPAADVSNYDDLRLPVPANMNTYRWLVIQLSDEFNSIFVPWWNRYITMDQLKQSGQLAFTTDKTVSVSFGAAPKFYFTSAHLETVFVGPFEINEKNHMNLILCTVEESGKRVALKAPNGTKAFWIKLDKNGGDVASSADTLSSTLSPTPSFNGIFTDSPENTTSSESQAKIEIQFSTPSHSASGFDTPRIQPDFSGSSDLKHEPVSDEDILELERQSSGGGPSFIKRDQIIITEIGLFSIVADWDENILSALWSHDSTVFLAYVLSKLSYELKMSVDNMHCLINEIEILKRRNKELEKYKEILKGDVLEDYEEDDE